MAGQVAMMIVGNAPPRWGITVGRGVVRIADVLEAFLCPEDHPLNDIPELIKIDELSPQGMSYLRPRDNQMINCLRLRNEFPPPIGAHLRELLDDDVLFAGRVLEIDRHHELLASNELYVEQPRWGDDLPVLPLSQLRERMPPCRLVIPHNCTHLDIEIQGMKVFDGPPEYYRLMYPQGIPMAGSGATILSGSYRLANGEPKKLLEIEV